MDYDKIEAGKDLDAEIAVRLFGWEWLEHDNDMTHSPRKGLFAPADSNWVRFNFHAPDWRPAKEDTPRFSDWYETCAIRAANGYDLKRRGLPPYSTSWDAAGEVVEKLGKQVVSLQLSTMHQGRRGRFAIIGEPLKPYLSVCHHWIAEAETFPLAICRVAMAFAESPTGRALLKAAKDGEGEG